MASVFFLGLGATAFYLAWWFQGRRILSPLFATALLAAGAYDFAQILGGWLLYLRATRRFPEAPSTPRSIDVYVTACHEPVAMVETSLRAAVAMRGEHTTYLLDDGDAPELRELAASVGARYLTRDGNRDAKAGNVNAALPETDGELIAIFDVDHVPAPEFLERTTGFFDDPAIGFVQVMLTFHNTDESWVARSAAHSTVDFFNPTSMGADGWGGASLIGTNAVIRREALRSIDGYRPGLAEDLATSIALHAAGWKSAYVAEPLAPGLAPADLRSWFTQQLKWSRGVFSVLLRSYTRYFPRLTWGQRLAYMVRMTYYWLGWAAAVHIAFTLVLLFFSNRIVRIDLQDYFVHMVPLVVVVLLMRRVALQCWRHAETPTSPGVLFWPLTLVYSTWPAYLWTWLMAIFRIRMRFRPTPKEAGARVPWIWLAPQSLTLIALVVGCVFAVVDARPADYAILIAMALMQGLPQAVFLLRAPGARADGRS